jgi:hypothetical protein
MESTPLCLLTPRKSRFFSPGLVHLMTHCNKLHERTSPIEILFFGHTLLDWTDRTLPRNPMPLVNSVLLGSISHLHAPNHLSPMHSYQLPSISVSVRQKSILRSSFVHYPGPTRSGTLCITSTSIPHPTHRPPNGKDLLLGCFALF